MLEREDPEWSVRCEPAPCAVQLSPDDRLAVVGTYAGDTQVWLVDPR